MTADADDRRGVVAFSAAAHSLTAVKKAAYTLLDRATVDIDAHGDSIVCTIELTGARPEITIDQVERDLKSEVLDQGLREVIAEETAPTRNALLAYAFSRTGLQDGE